MEEEVLKGKVMTVINCLEETITMLKSESSEKVRENYKFGYPVSLIMCDIYLIKGLFKQVLN